LKSITVLGAGNAGCAAAAHLTLMGFSVSMFNRWESELAPIREKGGIHVKGAVGEGFAEIKTVTTDIEEAAEGADFFLVVAPALAHDYFATQLARVIGRKGATIMLNPGHTGGALHFMQSLRKAGVDSEVRICETNTNTYICRLTGAAEVTVYGLARKVLFGALPGKYTDELAETVRSIYPFISPVESVLDTGFANVNAIMHPAGMLLNAGRIERKKGGFTFYDEGATQAVGRAIDALDLERLNVMKSLDLAPIPFVEVFYEYGATSDKALKTGSAYHALKESEANRQIMSPDSLTNRYLAEDIPFGLVPMAALANMVGVPTPVMDSLITLSCTVNDIDYWHCGLTLERMGLAGVNVKSIKERLYEGMSKV
jgi:opine dehydrogenase